MTERQYSVKLLRKIRKTYPDAFVYKIPDTAGLGGMRPFDIFIVKGGRAYAIELKRGGEAIRPTPYQEHMLAEFVKAGGISVVIWPEVERVLWGVLNEDTKWPF